MNRSIKQKIGWLLPVLLSAGLTAGCGTAAKKPAEVVVFAAASLTQTLTRLGGEYEKNHGDVRIIFNFDSSGTLKTQIEEGADCDVFISAGRKQMDELDITSDAAQNPDRHDLLLDGSRRDLLENKVVLVVPRKNPKGIKNFADLAEKLKSGPLLLAMGNEDVPVGQYTRKILAYYGLDESKLAAAGRLTYGSSAKEVTSQVAEGTVDGGVVYRTDARSAGLTIVDEAASSITGPVVYPAAVIRTSADPAGAAAFLDYLRSQPARAVFTEAGFSPVN